MDIIGAKGEAPRLLKQNLCPAGVAVREGLARPPASRRVQRRAIGVLVTNYYARLEGVLPAGLDGVTMKGAQVWLRRSCGSVGSRQEEPSFGLRRVLLSKAPDVDFFTWLPVGVNYNKPARGSVPLV